jgi:hypothetical protein
MCADGSWSPRVMRRSRYVERRRLRVYLFRVPDSSKPRNRPIHRHPRAPGIVRVLITIWLPLLWAGCATQQVANRRVLSSGESGTPGTQIGRLPACEKGQLAAENGKCLDVVVPAPAGEPATVRERILRQDCEKAKGLLLAAIQRRENVVSTKGHDIHLGLNAIVSECRARQEQLDICTRAGRYAEDSPFRREEVRLRDGLATCNELARVYRQMLAQGLRRAP